jgi:hypothetical protein
MPRPLPPTISRLLDRRDQAALLAAIAIAHDDPDADLLENCQRDLELQIEELAPEVWRPRFPKWVLQDLQRVHNPASDPQPDSCPRCSATDSLTSWRLGTHEQRLALPA